MKYCTTCNAPRASALAVLTRCGTCAIINGRLPPTKYIPIKGVE